MNYKIFIISLVVISIYSSCGATSQEELNKELLEAVCQNNHAQVLILLKAGADINTHEDRILALGFSGYTPLHYAVHYNYKKIAQLLLDFDAHINSIDTTQHTPLHYAARDHKFNLVELLLSHNAHVNVQDLHGETPLHLTFDKFFVINRGITSPNDYKLIELLFASGILFFCSNIITSPNHYKTIEILLSYGANVNAQSNSGQTPLH